MEWFIELCTSPAGVAHTILVLSVVIAVGVLLGNVKIGGVSLGVTWILFAGILAGHIHFTTDVVLLSFLQDFGLVLFVFGIGLQVGPGFFDNFGKGGVRLNLLAISILVLNVAVLAVCYFLFFDHNSPTLAMLTGVLCGAVTNTPGLGAASEAVQAVLGHGDVAALPNIANGYACAYPLAVVGIIGALLVLRVLCRVQMDKEEEDLARHDVPNPEEAPCVMALRVDNAAIAGCTILEMTTLLRRNFVVTRMYHNEELVVPNSKTVLTLGDDLYIVCAQSDAAAIKAFIGTETQRDFTVAPQQRTMVSQKIVVTNPKVNGKTIAHMHFSAVYGVNISRLTRQGMTLFASKNHHFHIGDIVTVVGPEENVRRVASVLGDTVKSLDHPNILTIFIGILLGIIVGQVPLLFPGMPVPLKLGIAGGPLVVAILIGRYGHRMRLITYMSTSANLLLREIGLSLFLACVGIKAGADFWSTIVAGDGIKYVLCGVLITVVPILVVAPLARRKMHLNFFLLMGVVAGAYTNPPALAFSAAACSREAPALAYSTVYPLTMFLRILTAQLIILLACA